MENFKITSYITLQSNNDDDDNFYFTDILPLGKKNPQPTIKAHSDAYSVLESGFGLVEQAGLALTADVYPST